MLEKSTEKRAKKVNDTSNAIPLIYFYFLLIASYFLQ